MRSRGFGALRNRFRRPTPPGLRGHNRGSDRRSLAACIFATLLCAVRGSGCVEAFKSKQRRSSLRIAACWNNHHPAQMEPTKTRRPYLTRGSPDAPPAASPCRRQPVRVKDIGYKKVKGHGLHLQGQVGHAVAFGIALIEATQFDRSEIHLPLPRVDLVQTNRMPLEQM